MNQTETPAIVTSKGRILRLSIGIAVLAGYGLLVYFMDSPVNRYAEENWVLGWYGSSAEIGPEEAPRRLLIGSAPNTQLPDSTIQMTSGLPGNFPTLTLPGKVAAPFHFDLVESVDDKNQRGWTVYFRGGPQASGELERALRVPRRGPELSEETGVEWHSDANLTGAFDVSVPYVTKLTAGPSGITSMIFPVPWMTRFDLPLKVDGIVPNLDKPPHELLRLVTSGLLLARESDPLPTKDRTEGRFMRISLSPQERPLLCRKRCHESGINKAASWFTSAQVNEEPRTRICHHPGDLPTGFEYSLENAAWLPDPVSNNCGDDGYSWQVEKSLVLVATVAVVSSGTDTQNPTNTGASREFLWLHPDTLPQGFSLSDAITVFPDYRAPQEWLIADGGGFLATFDENTQEYRPYKPTIVRMVKHGAKWHHHSRPVQLGISPLLDAPIVLRVNKTEVLFSLLGSHARIDLVKEFHLNSFFRRNQPVHHLPFRFPLLGVEQHSIQGTTYEFEEVADGEKDYTVVIRELAEGVTVKEYRRSISELYERKSSTWLASHLVSLKGFDIGIFGASYDDIVRDVRTTYLLVISTFLFFLFCGHVISWRNRKRHDASSKEPFLSIPFLMTALLFIGIALLCGLGMEAQLSTYVGFGMIGSIRKLLQQWLALVLGLCGIIFVLGPFVHKGETLHEWFFNLHGFRRRFIAAIGFLLAAAVAFTVSPMVWNAPPSVQWEDFNHFLQPVTKDGFTPGEIASVQGDLPVTNYGSSLQDPRLLAPLSSQPTVKDQVKAVLLLASSSVPAVLLAGLAVILAGMFYLFSLVMVRIYRFTTGRLGSKEVPPGKRLVNLKKLIYLWPFVCFGVLAVLTLRNVSSTDLDGFNTNFLKYFVILCNSVFAILLFIIQRWYWQHRNNASGIFAGSSGPLRKTKENASGSLADRKLWYRIVLFAWNFHRLEAVLIAATVVVLIASLFACWIWIPGFAQQMKMTWLLLLLTLDLAIWRCVHFVRSRFGQIANSLDAVQDTTSSLLVFMVFSGGLVLVAMLLSGSAFIPGIFINYAGTLLLVSGLIGIFWPNLQKGLSNAVLAVAGQIRMVILALLHQGEYPDWVTPGYRLTLKLMVLVVGLLSTVAGVVLGLSFANALAFAFIFTILGLFTVAGIGRLLQQQLLRPNPYFLIAIILYVAEVARAKGVIPGGLPLKPSELGLLFTALGVGRFVAELWQERVIPIIATTRNLNASDTIADTIGKTFLASLAIVLLVLHFVPGLAEYGNALFGSQLSTSVALLSSLAMAGVVCAVPNAESNKSAFRRFIQAWPVLSFLGMTFFGIIVQWSVATLTTPITGTFALFLSLAFIAAVPLLLAGLDSQDAEEDNSEHLATVEDDALSLGDSSPSSATALGSPTLDLALVLIGLLAIIVVLFFMAQDLGVMSVVSTTLILVLTMIVLFVSRVYRQGLTGLMREREAALAWQITCLAVLVAVWAVFVLPQFAEAVARFFGYTRVLVRTECAASSYYYFECQQALSGLRQIIEGSGSGRYWIANAHSDLIFGTVAGNLGNWGLAVLVAGLSAIMAPLLWSIHRHLQAAVKHLTGSFNAQPKIDPYSGIESAALQLFLVSAFFIQVCVHVASGLASTYQIGITLPFVSQGGGSLIAWLIALGICARHMLMVRQSADWR